MELMTNRIDEHISQTTVHHVIGIDGTTLIVFYTDAHCWQFRLISPSGAVFGKAEVQAVQTEEVSGDELWLFVSKNNSKA